MKIKIYEKSLINHMYKANSISWDFIVIIGNL